MMAKKLNENEPSYKTTVTVGQWLPGAAGWGFGGERRKPGRTVSEGGGRGLMTRGLTGGHLSE